MTSDALQAFAREPDAFTRDLLLAQAVLQICGVEDEAQIIAGICATEAWLAEEEEKPWHF
jgi:hypothetical protein